MTNINDKIRIAKKRLLEMHFASKVGHLGGNLSALDVMMVLHHEIMTAQDVFILSKGHSAGALYVTLWSKGCLTDVDLQTFHADNTKLAGHPMAGCISEISVATGSLGHGFSIALGVALGRKLANMSGHVYCLTSDGEWQEGSNWEALIFLAHHKLDNFTLLIDCNGLQGFGTTADVASMPTSTLRDRISAFNFKVTQVNGHVPNEIQRVLENPRNNIVMLDTIKGSGISFMENKMEWHYLPLNEQLFRQAIVEIDKV